MKTQTEIHWNHAERLAENHRRVNKVKFAETIAEIKETNVEMLDFRDILFFSESLSEYDPEGRKWTPQMVRRLFSHSSDADILGTFQGDDTDEILNIY